MLIEDDDYMFVGLASAREGTVRATVVELDEDDNPVGLPWEEEITITDPAGDLRYFAGFIDGDWLPWITGEATAPGDSAEDVVTVLAGGDIGAFPVSGGFSGGSTGSGPFTPVAGDPMLHAANLALLEDHRPGWTFRLSPHGNHYYGQDGKGRRVSYALDLTEVFYVGTSHSWYLKFHDDGSIEKFTDRFNGQGPLVEEIKPSDKFLRELDGVFGPYLQQAEEDRERFAAFTEARQMIGEALEAAVRMTPPAVFIDAQELWTGENAFKPGVELSGTDRALAAASLAPIGVVGMIASARKAVNAQELLRNNVRAGKAFEADVLQALGDMPKNKLYMIESVIRGGKVRRTIPDGLLFTTRSMVEVKRVNYQHLSSQIEAQINYAKDNGLTYRLVLLPGATISNELVVHLRKHPNMAFVLSFDPVTRMLKQIFP